MLKINRFPNAECEGPPKGCGGGSQCSANAKCTDNAASEDEDNLYNCVCNAGFKGDGKMCERGLSLKCTVMCAVRIIKISWKRFLTVIQVINENAIMWVKCLANID